MSFSEYIAAERVRIGQRKQEISAQIAKLRTQDSELDNELAAIQAYESHKRGGKKVGEARREGVIDSVRAEPGIRRAGICNRMGAHTDSQKQAISGVLTALVREGVLRRGDKGAYFVN